MLMYPKKAPGEEAADQASAEHPAGGPYRGMLSL